MTAGYSGTPLPQKLGVRPGARVLLMDAPPELTAEGGPLGPGAAPAGAVFLRRASGAPFDVAAAFCPDLATLRRRFAATAPRVAARGGLWICWPKRASGIATDITEAAVREHGLGALEQPGAIQWVDVKIAAIDATWSGLKFVRRVDQAARR